MFTRKTRIEVVGSCAAVIVLLAVSTSAWAQADRAFGRGGDSLRSVNQGGDSRGNWTGRHINATIQPTFSSG